MCPVLIFQRENLRLLSIKLKSPLPLSVVHHFLLLQLQNSLLILDILHVPIFLVLLYVFSLLLPIENQISMVYGPNKTKLLIDIYLGQFDINRKNDIKKLYLLLFFLLSNFFKSLCFIIKHSLTLFSFFTLIFHFLRYNKKS